MRGQIQCLDLQLEQVTSSFILSSLPLTGAALEGLSELDVSDWLDRLPQAHRDDEPIDRLIVATMPSFGVEVFRHYALRGPSLLEKCTRRQVGRIDRLLAEIVVVVADRLDEDAVLRNMSLSSPQEVLGRILPKGRNG